MPCWLLIDARCRLCAIDDYGVVIPNWSSNAHDSDHVGVLIRQYLQHLGEVFSQMPRGPPKDEPQHVQDLSPGRRCMQLRNAAMLESPH